MVNMNIVIANNIAGILKEQKKKQTDLAEALHTNKQTVNKMLNGSRLINAVELKQISEYLGVTMEVLARLPENDIDTNIVHAFMGKVNSASAKEALAVADKLSDLILFHRRVRENGTKMMSTWGDE